MTTVHAEPELMQSVDAGARRRPIVAFMLVGVCVLLVLGIFAPTVASMAAVWARSETFKHCFLVLPASLWMMWLGRAELAKSAPRPFWPGLLGVAGACFAWLVGELASAAVLTHLSVIAVAIASVVTVFGLRWARVLAFPLAFLFFAAPFGEGFIPKLIDWTANFTVAALQVSGVPVFREGNNLTIPNGRWSVVEACSGVRYLIASLMTGSLYAWLMYRSAGRRAAFIAASIAVPIVANWVRAYMIVMLGYLSDNTIATGVDHLVYGWVFFGALMTAMFWIGARWREDHTPLNRAHETAGVPWSAGRIVPVALCVAAVVIFTPLTDAALQSSSDTRPVRLIPAEPAGGWIEQSNAAGDWSPRLTNPRALSTQRLSDGQRSVTVHVGFYRDQRNGSELVSIANHLVSEDSLWSVVSRGSEVAAVAGQNVAVHEAVLRRGVEYRRVWHWYWLHGHRVTASDTRAKLTLALDRVRQRSDSSAWIAASTAHDPDHPESSQAALRDFLGAMGPQLDSALQATALR